MQRMMVAVIFAGQLIACSSGSNTENGQVFFGDLHAHSTFSAPDLVGNATPAEFYRMVRDDLGFDFVALSDHDGFLTAEEWDIIRETAPMFDDPGRFVAFSAVEWTHRWHMNTIFRHDDEEICDCIEAPQYYDYHRDLIEARDAASHLNHPAGIFLPIWSQIDDSLTKNVEVYNASASEQEHSFSGAIWSLRAGFRFGFVGVSDDHMTDAMPPIIGNGITGCHARELTRSAILDALHDRRCYATTGERIIVDTEIAATPMGGIATSEIGTSVPARISITGTETPFDIELVVNGASVASKRCTQLRCQLDAPIQIDDPYNFAYARVTQPNNQRAWSTPVWIHADCPSGAEDCLEQRLAPAGDDTTSDCLSELLFPAAAKGESYQLSPAAIRCEDGDAACDAGDTEGQCAIRVGICFAVEDSRRPSCAPVRAAEFEVLEPPANTPHLSLDWQNRRTLEAIFQATHTTADKPKCSGIAALQVPVGEQRTFRISTRSATRTDNDTFTLECTQS